MINWMRGAGVRLVKAFCVSLAAGFVLAAQTDAMAQGVVQAPQSNRVTINLGDTPWRLLVSNGNDPVNVSAPACSSTAAAQNNNVCFDDSAGKWISVGVPETPNDMQTYLNEQSGGGAGGEMSNNEAWYRKHFTLDPSYANRKVFVEFEASHFAARVYVNGHFLPGNSRVAGDAGATHVNGFFPFVVDVTPYVNFDGSDNVIAVNVAYAGEPWYVSPNFSGNFRFGQQYMGLWRPAKMYITDRVYIPQNVYATLNTWGTYVSTLSASSSAADIRVQTNVRNEYSSSQPVTLNTEIVDAGGTVVASAQASATLPSAPLPTTPAKNDPGVGDPPPTFDQTLTVNNPTLWYPNNSIFGSPYLYSVVQTVSINGVVVDSTQTPLGIRTITWNQNNPIINGHAHFLWGTGARYDWPALGAAVPEEFKWRDAAYLAAAGGSLYRPGHTAEGPEFVAAADAYGIMIIQPSGDGENGFANLCTDTGTAHAQGCTANADDQELKREDHRDMIVAYRNNPSILAWEADNGVTDTGFAQGLKALSLVWDPIQQRVQGDRTPNPANGDILGCSGDGCDINVKKDNPNSPSWGSEYWGNGIDRAQYDWELAFAATPVNDWVNSVGVNSFGIAHWYLADTPGEVTTQSDNLSQTPGQGTLPADVRSNAASMMDHNRIPRLLYYIYAANWTPKSIRPVVKLSSHWNPSRGANGPVTVNAFSNCDAVRLILNGTQLGADQFPNPTNNTVTDLTQNTTSLPGQVHWSNITWQAGKLQAVCLDSNHEPVTLAGSSMPVMDEQDTSTGADHILLTFEQPLQAPFHAPFAITANGTDAARITATIVDSQNRIVADDPQRVITFAVSGPGTYEGSADHFVTYMDGGSDNIPGPNGPTANNPPQAWPYHSPGDLNLNTDGAMQRVTVRSQFTPGTVTVTATSPGLGNGSVSFTTVPVTGPTLNASGTSLNIPAQPASDFTIVGQPQDQEVTVGQSATFTVLVAGAASPTYQWLKNGTPIQGATGFTLVTPKTASGDNGANYSVQVSNGTATPITSNKAILTVDQPTAPAIVTQPLAQTVVAGGTAQFSVKVSGSPTISYQWFENGNPISGATGAIYDTPLLTTQDNNSTFYVVVQNGVGSPITSNTVTLTVQSGASPEIVTPPSSLSAVANQTVTFQVLASGTAPLSYQWAFNGNPVGTNSPTFVIPSVSSADAGAYTVTVNNASGPPVTSPVATLSVSGSNGSNLALGMNTFESGDQNAGVLNAGPTGTASNNLSSANAVDGNLTATRWSSDFDDNAWMTVDLGSRDQALHTFNQVSIQWENARAALFQLQTSNTNNGSDWKTVQTTNPQPADAAGDIAGPNQAGPQNYNFSSVTARYVRMQGVTRATQFGYSMFEFQVYDVPQCGAATERYTQQAARPGTYQPTDPNLQAGPFVPTVLDNDTGLTWQQFVTTYPQEGAQFTQISANNYCSTLNTATQTWRVPTLAEAQTIAGVNYASCAFPNPWTIWTSTSDPSDPTTRAFFESSTGISSSQIINNSPGAALCVSGPSLAAPTVTVPPASQTVPLGSTATFTVTATGVAPLSYQWMENGVVVGTTTTPVFTTAPVQSSDNNAQFTVLISNGGGSATSAAATLTIGAAGGGGNGGNNGGTGNDGGGNNGGGNNGGGNPPPPPPSPSANIALGAQTFQSGDQNIGATGNGTDGLASGNAVDGNLGSRWSSDFDDNAWITVNLGSKMTFNRFVLRWENAFGKQYVIETSNDNATWTPAFTQNNGQGGTEDIVLPQGQTVTAQYVRMQGVKRATQFGYSLFEFEIYNTANTPQFLVTANAGPNGAISPAGSVQLFQGGQQTFQFQPAAGFAATGIIVDGQSQGVINGYTFSNVQIPHSIGVTFSPAAAAVDLALNQPTSQSGDENIKATGNGTDGLSSANAVDGNLGTRWSSDFDDNAWMTVQLGNAPVTFDRVVINWQNANQSYLLQVSNDNQTWQTVYTQNNGKGGIEDATFTPVSARYIRFQGVSRGNNGFGYSFFEFSVYNVPTGQTEQAPAITTQLGTVSVSDGQPATLTVGATGGAPLTFQWYENGTLIGTTNTPSFTTAPLSAANDNNAQFWVVVSNATTQTAMSNKVTATVQAGIPVITTQPVAQTVQDGHVVTFTIAATGSAPLSYQWFENNTLLGTTSVPTFTTGPLSAANDNSAQFWVVVNNATNKPVTSNKVVVTVQAIPPAITGQPVAQTATVGNTATFTATASGSAPLTYTWFENGNQIGTGATFTTKPLTTSDNNAQIWVVVNNASNQPATSNKVVLTVQSVAPTITTQPVGQSVAAGSSATFSVAANGSAPLSYAWFENGTSIGTNSPNLTTGALSVANDNNAQIWVVVTNAAGQTVQSNKVTVTVTAAATQPTQPTQPQQPATGDLALGMAATQSGDETVGAAGNATDGLSANNAVDGNLNSRWSSNFADNAWMTVNLGSRQTFNEVVLRWQNAFGKQYLIQVSNDNATWTTVFTQNSGQGGDEYLTFAPQTAQYVRMQGVQRNTQYGYSLFEFEVYNTATAPSFTLTAAASANGTITPAGTDTVLQGSDVTYTFTPAAGFAVGGVTVDGQVVGMPTSYAFQDVTANHSLSVTFVPAAAAVDLALKKSTHQSGDQNVGATGDATDGLSSLNAVDGSQNSRWSSDFDDNAWMTVDLGAPTAFNQAVIFWENAFGKQYLIQSSPDNATWTTIFTQSAGKGGVETLSLPLTTARYVRLQGVQRNTQFGYSIFEFQLFNTGNGSTAQPPVITGQPQSQTVSAGQSAVFSVAASGDGPFTYQWLKSGNPISGATASSYSTPATATTDSGATFSVKVTDANGLTTTSQAATLTVTAALPYQVFPGMIGVELKNNTNTAYTDDQIYVAVLGNNPADGNPAWVQANGTITDMAVADNTASNHLTGPDGQSYPNYFFTIAQAKNLLLLPKMDGGRIYIALGSPLFMKVNPAGANGKVGLAQPNPQNGTDPNNNIYFDWYEFTYNGTGQGVINVNTTQVDEFGMPMTLDVYANNATFHQQVGINESRAAIYAEYLAETPAEFHQDAQSQFRIFAPAKGTFGAGQPNAAYFDNTIAQIWTQYAIQPLNITMSGNSYVGTIQSGQLVFNQVDPTTGAVVNGPYAINRPTTQDILFCNGSMANGGGVVAALEAQVCAAFNRAVMGNAAQWAVPADFYQASVQNWYAMFWHKHSINNLAYGFSFDDVNGQSTLITTGLPEHMVLGIGF